MSSSIHNHLLFGYEWRVLLAKRGGSYPRDPRRIKELPHNAALELAQRRCFAQHGIETLHDLFQWLVRRQLGTETPHAYEVGKARFFDVLRRDLGDPFVANMWGSLTGRGGDGILEDCDQTLRLRKRRGGGGGSCASMEQVHASREPPATLKTEGAIDGPHADDTEEGSSSSSSNSSSAASPLCAGEPLASPPPPLRLPANVPQKQRWSSSACAGDEWRDLVLSTARVVLGEEEVPRTPPASMPAPLRRV